MTPLDFVPKWVLAAIAALSMAALVAAGFGIKALELQVSQAKTELAEAKLEHSEAVLEAQARHVADEKRYRDTERSLQTAMDNQRKVTNETISSLAAERDALKLRLLQEASATYSLGVGRTSTVGLNAKDFIRQDVPLVSWEIEYLVDEAFRADEIRVELLACYKAYDDAKAALEAPVKAAK